LPFSLPLETVKTLANSESRDFKTFLLDWAQSNCQLDRQTLADNLLLQNAEKIPVYEITLVSMLETRSPELEEIIRPITDSTPPTTEPAAIERIDVWEHPTETPPDLTEHKGIFPIRPTLRLFDCVICLKKGVVTCDHCQGSGQATCSNCRGRGLQPCHYCKGLAKTNCLKCNGSGLKDSASIKVKSSDACPHCQGTGHISCPQCSDGNVVCSICAGHRYLPCEQCRSKGEIVCQVCQGKGQVIKGYGFRAEFKPFQYKKIAAVTTIPQGLMDKTLVFSGTTEPHEIDPGDFNEEAVKQSGLPETVIAVLTDLLQQLKPFSSEKSRFTRRQILLRKAEVLRLAGTVLRQPFLYWVSPDSKRLIDEINPLKDMGETTAVAARQAWDAHEWSKAEELARHALTFSPDHPAALGILAGWKRKFFLQNLSAAEAAALLSAAVCVFLIGYRQPGLHKTGALITAVSSLISVGALLAVFLSLIKKNVYRVRRRWVINFSLSLAGLLLFIVAAHVGFKWNGVRDADQAALSQEFRRQFPFGVSKVYWEPDLQFLEALNKKYKETQVDLTELGKELKVQQDLQATHLKMKKEFNAKLNTVLTDGTLRPEKIVRLQKMKAAYSIYSVDVSAAEAAIQRFEAEEATAAAVKTRAASSISIKKVKKQNAAGKKTPKKTKSGSKKTASKK